MNINKLRKVLGGIMAAVILLTIVLATSALARVPNVDLLAGQKEQNSCGYRPDREVEALQKKVGTEPLEGTELDKVVRKALKSKDVRNVLKSASQKLDVKEAKAACHVSEAEDTILALAIPTETGALAYYSYEGVEGLESKAVLYQISEDGEAVQLIAISINGSPVAPLGHELTGSRRTVTVLNCGNCTDPYKWDYYCRWCASTDWGCVARSCSVCMIACAGGLTPPCMVCLLVWCPISAFGWCCTSWQETCCSCGPMP